MKVFPVVLLFILSHPLYAQQINGQVIDPSTKLPVAHAEIIYGIKNIATGIDGKFNFEKTPGADHVLVKKPGYETSVLNFKDQLPDTLRIYLQAVVVNLAEVTIHGKRNYIMDSLKLRQEYASIFNYKTPKFKDLFVKKGLRYKSPFPNVVSNSTATLFTLDVSKMIGLLGKNKSPVSKLQKIQLKEEEMNYVDHHFSEEKVNSLTRLQGDSLKHFMERYRPASTEIRKMNDYEILLYIKKSYDEFIRPNN